ncbi:MAG: class I SAM-dependent methyltransferase [Chloroflexi bacterium]|nr:class I SAM-dependent methyltransferase [Chloroflexota bacterium]
MNGALTRHEMTAVQAFLGCLFSESNAIAVRFGDSSQLMPQPTGTTTIVINSPNSLRRMFRPPIQRSLGEAYIRGDFDIQGDLTKIFESFHMPDNKVMGKLPALARLWSSLPHENHYPQLLRPNSTYPYHRGFYRKRVQKVIQDYDAGNDFYALWLDTKMLYSCAYFLTDDEDLDTAQDHSLDLICRKLNLEQGEKLLDINCGWGGLVLHAAKHYGVSVLGTTPNQRQQFFANQRIATANLRGTMVKMTDYRDLTAGTFDKITNISLLQHTTRTQLSQHFAHIYRLLKPGGLFLNRRISAYPSFTRQEPCPIAEQLTKNILLGPSSFIPNKIFPDRELPMVGEVNLIAEKNGFEICHLENLRKHYILTLRHWLKRLDDQRAQAIQLTDEATYRVWRLYFTATIYGFESGNYNASETLFYKPLNSRNDIALPRTRHCHGI